MDRSQVALKGEDFENCISAMLDSYLKQRDGLYLSDLRLRTPTRNGYSQIDFLLLTPCGYICIEAKNWSCILINDYGDFWEVKYNNNYYRTLSPVKQNETHIIRIKNYIPEKKIVNLVCFCNEAKVSGKSQNVITLSELIPYLDDFLNRDRIIGRDAIVADYNILCKEKTDCLIMEAATL